MVRKIAVSVVAVLVILVVIVGGASYWLGMQAQKAYSALMQNIGDGGRITVSNVSYERGWLSSTAEATISVPGLPIGLSVISRIQHGPFPAIADLQFMPGMAVVKSEIAANSPGLAKLPPINARTMVFLDGNSKTQLNIPAFTRSAPGATSYSWLPASGSFTVDPGQTIINGDITFPQVKFSSATASALVTQATVNWTQPTGASGLAKAEYSLAIGHLATTGAKGKMSIDGLRLMSTEGETAGSIMATLSVQVHTVNDGTSSFGPGQVSMQLRNVDALSLTKYQKEVQALENRKLPADQLGPALQGKTTELIMNLVRKAPELDVSRLALQVGGNEITGTAKYVLDGSGLPAGEIPTTFMQAASGEGKVSVPRAVIATLAQNEIHHQLDVYKTQGALTPDEVKELTPDRISSITDTALPSYMDRVVARLDLAPDAGDFQWIVAPHQGQLLINDKPV
ncbi:MAG: DUF945 family protein, partial [Acidiferrobacterales bacterium]